MTAPSWAVLALALAVAACGGTRSADGDRPVAPAFAPPEPGLQVGPETLVSRRARLAEAVSDGLVLLIAEPSAKSFREPGWEQNASFFYFTGLIEGTHAVLLIDAPAGRSSLFVGGPPVAFGAPANEIALPIDESLVRRTAVDEVLPWERFVPRVRERVRAGVPIYLDAARHPAPPGAPPGLPPLADVANLWRHAVAAAFPDAELRRADEAIVRLRWTKEGLEQEQLRRNAAYSAFALMRGMRAVGPGRRQRLAEAAVVAGCLEAGANGPSFWPWMQSGPNAHLERLVNSFHAYDNLDRTMEAGELLRADVGCAAGGYGGDVGRTVPVSGRFTEEQALVWDHLVAAYRAGIAAMGPGVPLEAVRDAAAAHLAARAADAEREREGRLLRAMADQVDWHIHGIGIESAEANAEALETGTVIAFEPMFVHGVDAFYLEDMILITADGAEVLTAEVPTTAEEIAAFLRR